MEGLLKDFAIEIEILWEMLREKLRTPQILNKGKR